MKPNWIKINYDNDLRVPNYFLDKVQNNLIEHCINVYRVNELEEPIEANIFYLGMVDNFGISVCIDVNTLDGDINEVFIQNIESGVTKYVNY